MSSPIQQRRDGRMAAVQFLYSWEINRPEDLAQALELFFAEQEQPRDHFAFGEELIHGAIEHMSEIDGHIRGLAQNWDFERIAKIDLTILRVGIHEMLHRKDIPPVVSINEAINLSKQFSNADAKRFINGILDRLKDQLGRDARKTAEE
ncbi:MAG TPA: transcription antitermination factor NusB [Opitutaceae bacterium]|nr:transcription antitermination factor NusB [Opitutaceae bacterium]